MNPKLEVDYEGDHIHARQFGPTNFDVSLELWTRIAAACEEHDCFNILGESFISGPTGVMDGYDHTEIFRLAGITMRHRIAWVNHNDEHTEWFQFIENVLRNRGLANGHLFATVQEAKQWLLEGDNG